MRKLVVCLAFSALLLGAAPSLANTINFGSLTNNSSCSLAGNGADRSCTNTGSVSNGANDAVASLNIRGQASADHGLTTNATAIADLTVSYSVPYTVTRTVSVVPNVSAPADLVIPNQQILFNLNFSGEVSKDNSQVGGGLGQALLDTLGFTVSSGLFGSVLMGGDISQTGGGGLARSPFNRATPDLVGNTGRNFAGPGAGEISFAFEIPTNYQDWEDFNAPYAIDYGTGGSFTQSFTDTLTLSFRLRAESRPSGSVSTTGGEALACAGQTSPLGAFDLDDGASCGSGLTVAATVSQTGTTVEPVPEPTTVALLALGLGSLAWVSRRRQG